jgi:hypothetical protein
MLEYRPNKGPTHDSQQYVLTDVADEECVLVGSMSPFSDPTCVWVNLLPLLCSAEQFDSG